MSDTEDPPRRTTLEKQLAMNQKTWRALQEHGVTLTSELRLDFTYLASDQAAAKKLKALLEDQTDYDVHLKSAGGLFDKHWTVVGTTQPTTISPEILDQWVTWMVTAGFESDCQFDGWGTEV